jgi:hypothetical protein
MVLTKIALVCALLTAGQAPADAVYTNLRTGRIPSVINPERTAEIRELQLFMSPDRGRSWTQVDKITPDKDGFSYSTPVDGEYWYHVVIVNQQGKQEPADLYKTPPMMKLVVDTKAPEVKITSAQRQGDELVVSWLVREDNPDPPKLQLEYRAADAGTWTPIQLSPSPQGTAKVRLNTQAPLAVRLQFKDLAGNAASVEEQVGGTVAGAGYNTQAVNSKMADAPLPVVPAPTTLPDRLPAPPPPPVNTLPATQELQVTGGPAAVPPQPAPAPKMVAIASSADGSQGSPVPVQMPNQASPRSMPAVQVVNEPEIVVEYELSKVGPSGLSKIEVWITRDRGANWERFAEDRDANQATAGGRYQRTLPLPGEGVYGISLVVKSKAGIGKPAPRAGDIPEMLVEVDTTPPEAKLLELMPDPQRRDTVILSWVATDRNLAPNPVTLDWAEKAAGPWQTIAANLPNSQQNSGRYPWLLPKTLPSHVYLKLTVRDTAGNEAVAVTREPQLVDLSEPEGRLVRVMPANKR